MTRSRPGVTIRAVMARRFSLVPIAVTVLSLSLSVGLHPAATKAATAGTRTPADPTYIVNLSGDSDGRRWSGTERIDFRNTSSVSLGTIWLRLWSNGVAGCQPKAIVVTKVVGGTAGSLSRGCTALPVKLSAPLAPGATATLSMRVSITVPARSDRFGYFDGISMLGTALPTLAIHDGGGWNLDPYSDLGDSYYSVAGEYRVTLTVPAALSTPTTGTLITQTSNPDGTQTRSYSASNVRDFEWAAGALHEIDARDSAGVLVRVWYMPAYVDNADAGDMLAVAVDSMNTYSADFGAYPYPEVDVVLTWLGYGMEYPTIVFTIPRTFYVSHELAHQWWYGIVGDDQYDSPWLDESFASWSETLPYYQYSCDGAYPWPSDGTRITKSMSYWARHADDYWVVYEQGACALADAADHLGFDRLIGLLHDYAQAHWFGFSTTADFKSAIEAAAAQSAPGWDVDAFWREWRIGPAR